MSQPETPRMLFVHAHPDDESLCNGGTIAHYVGLGVAVNVVTCTLGEEAEVIGDRYALLVGDHADQLGGYRISELTKALNALGVDEPTYLGGAGRWRDSGMPAKPLRDRATFVDSGDDAVRELVALIDTLRPHVVVTYDPHGGYGHPDHIKTHRVTTAALDASTWKVPKFYWTVLASSAMLVGLDALTDLPPDWSKLPRNVAVHFGYADTNIDAVIDSGKSVDAKREALAAHATQVIMAPDGRSFALSQRIAVPLLAEEHYILAAGEAGSRDGRGWETDLLAGLSLGH